MASVKYDGNSLIGKYIDACQQDDHPINERQIGILEKTINDVFGIRKLNKSPPIDLVKPINEEILGRAGTYTSYASTGRVRNILEGYRKNNHPISDELPITEAEAWSLYMVTHEEVWRNPVPIEFKELKRKYKIPKTYGGVAYQVLRKYFQQRGLLNEDGDPIQADDRPENT